MLKLSRIGWVRSSVKFLAGATITGTTGLLLTSVTASALSDKNVFLTDVPKLSLILMRFRSGLVSSTSSVALFGWLTMPPDRVRLKEFWVELWRIIWVVSSDDTSTVSSNTNTRVSLVRSRVKYRNDGRVRSETYPAAISAAMSGISTTAFVPMSVIAMEESVINVLV